MSSISLVFMMDVHTTAPGRYERNHACYNHHHITITTLYIIISPKFEISGILWFWSGRRRRPDQNHNIPEISNFGDIIMYNVVMVMWWSRLVFHVTATPMHVSNS